MTNPYFQDQGAPVPQQPPVVPQRPKRTGIVVLSVVAVLLLGGAGAFAALWIVERGDHDKTTEQLSTRDKELADEKKAHEGTKTKLGETEKAKTDADAKVAALTPCAEAGKKLTQLALSGASEEEGVKAGEAIVLACGR